MNVYKFQENNRFEMQVQGAQVPGIRCTGSRCQAADYRCQMPGSMCQGQGKLKPNLYKVLICNSVLHLYSSLAHFCYHNVILLTLEIPATQNITKHPRRYTVFSQNVPLKQRPYSAMILLFRSFLHPHKLQRG